ncbi:MAG: hypothetical protein R3F49_03160 [Planctomycetota bacterium]
MANLVMESGAMGLLSIAVTVAVALAMLAAKSSRSTTIALTSLAFVPLALGLIGTAMGRKVMAQTMEATGGLATPADREAGERQALSSTWVGGAGTLVLVFVLGCRVALGQGRE